MTTRYIFKNIRTLLSEGFNPKELYDFCHDNEKFRSVCNEANQDTDVGTIVSLIIDHANKRLLFLDLLDWAKQNNPHRFGLHGPYYDEVSQPDVGVTSPWPIKGSELSARHEKRQSYIDEPTPSSLSSESLPKTPDISRLGKPEVQLVTAKSKVKQPKGEAKVQVSLEYLTELRGHQEHLDSYVIGYIVSLELDALCDKIRSYLGRSRLDPTKVDEYYYWDDFQGLLDEASKKATYFPSLMRSELILIEQFEKAIQKAKAAVTGLGYPSKDTDKGNLVKDVKQSTDEMHHTVELITTESKQKTEAVLGQIRTCIALIFKPIKNIEEGKPVSEKSQPLGGYTDKIRPKIIEPEKKSQPLKGRSQP